MIWPISVALVVLLILTDDLVEYALAITAGSFVVAVLFLTWATWLTSRRDRRTREDRA